MLIFYNCKYEIVGRPGEEREGERGGGLARIY